MNKHLLGIGLMLTTAAVAQTPTSKSCSPYLGVALSWDHMSGNHSDKLTNFADSTLTFSNGAKLSSDTMAGYLFFGVEYRLPNLPLFISPEIQLGGGMMSSQTTNSVGDGHLLVGLNNVPLARTLSPKLSQQFTSSFAVRAGANVDAATQLYGLAGINMSRFKYGFTYQIVDSGAVEPAILGATRYTFSKWRTAPVIGAGIEKKIKDIKIGLEYRMAFYKHLKFSTKATTADAESETVTANYKPRVSSVMLRVSYPF